MAQAYQVEAGDWNLPTLYAQAMDCLHVGVGISYTVSSMQGGAGDGGGRKGGVDGGKGVDGGEGVDGGSGALGASKEGDGVLGEGHTSPVRSRDVRVDGVVGRGGDGTTGAEKEDVAAPSPAKQIAAGALMFASAAAIAALEYTAVTAASGGM